MFHGQSDLCKCLLVAGDKEVRQTGFSPVDHASRSSPGQDINDRGSSKQKSPVVNDLLKKKDAKVDLIISFFFATVFLFFLLSVD